jgi:hypothetical protein
MALYQNVRLVGLVMLELGVVRRLRSSDMKAITITAYTEDASQIEAIKAVIKALKIKDKISKVQEVEGPYDPEFVAMIKQGQQDIKDGKGIKITLDELNRVC